MLEQAERMDWTQYGLGGGYAPDQTRPAESRDENHRSVFSELVHGQMADSRPRWLRGRLLGVGKGSRYPPLVGPSHLISVCLPGPNITQYLGLPHRTYDTIGLERRVPGGLIRPTQLP